VLDRLGELEPLIREPGGRSQAGQQSALR
jgi:hypothetical protein